MSGRPRRSLIAASFAAAGLLVAGAASCSSHSGAGAPTSAVTVKPFSQLAPDDRAKRVSDCEQLSVEYGAAITSATAQTDAQAQAGLVQLEALRAKVPAALQPDVDAVATHVRTVRADPSKLGARSPAYDAAVQHLQDYVHEVCDVRS